MPVKACESKILIDQFDFSGATNGWAINAEVKSIDYAVLQNCAQLRLPGLPMANIEHNGYYTGAGAGNLEYEMNARLGSSAVIRVAVIMGTGLTVPVAVVMNSTWNQQLKLKAPIEGLLEISGNWPAGNEKMVRGYQVYVGTPSATGALATVDMGAAATGAGSKAFLFVQAKTGTITSATVTVQSSAASNFSSPTTHGTFTFSGLGAFEVDLTGTLGRYTRLNVTSLGGATDFTIVGVVCSFGNTFS